MDASGPRKILIVDDEPGLRQSVKQALRTDGRRIEASLEQWMTSTPK